MPVLKQLALKVGPLRRLYEDRNRLASKLAQGLDLENGLGQNRFYHYTAAFDAIGTMRRYAVANLKPTPGYLTNWLGVRIDPKFFPHLLVGRAGEVEGIPIPANWHADIAEWAVVLQAVDDANPDIFTMIELGCGWGCWMNNAGMACTQHWPSRARHRG